MAFPGPYDLDIVHARLQERFTAAATERGWDYGEVTGPDALTGLHVRFYVHWKPKQRAVRDGDGFRAVWVGEEQAFEYAVARDLVSKVLDDLSPRTEFGALLYLMGNKEGDIERKAADRILGYALPGIPPPKPIAEPEGDPAASQQEVVNGR